MTVFTSGRGKPVTIIARGESYRAFDALGYGRGVGGCRVSFVYEESGHFSRLRSCGEVPSTTRARCWRLRLISARRAPLGSLVGRAPSWVRWRKYRTSLSVSFSCCRRAATRRVAMRRGWRPC